MKALVIILSSFLFANLAQAQCVYNGQSYAEGSVVGPYTCSNGKWIQ